MQQDAQHTSPHPSHKSAGTTNRVSQLSLRSISPGLSFEGKDRAGIDTSRFTVHAGLLKQQMQHAREFCKGSLRNINSIVNHAIMSERQAALAQ